MITAIHAGLPRANRNVDPSADPSTIGPLVWAAQLIRLPRPLSWAEALAAAAILHGFTQGRH